jgi:diadenylate cyclase
LGFLDQIVLLVPGWQDLLEILIVAYAIYWILLLFRGNRALQMLVAIVGLVSIYALASLFNFLIITALLGRIFEYGVLALLIIFAPELRSGLAVLGQAHSTRFFRHRETVEVAEEIASAVERLSRSNRGAIIAVQNEMDLSEYVQSGSAIQAKVSADLLSTIFTPYTPLHDGAVLIKRDTIFGAGCILPLSSSEIHDRSLGTRHRAALGLSEETDALVVVVSEETSIVSVAQQGRLTRNVSPGQLRDILSGRAPRTTADTAQVLSVRA